MNTERNLIAIVGMAGSGKSEAAAFFKDKGFSILRFGDAVDIELGNRNWERTQPNERKVREEIRKNLGMAGMAILIEPRINAISPDQKNVVLDGLYSWEEYIYLHDKFPQLILICIYARPAVRYARLSGRPVRPLNPVEARDRDIAELEKLNKGGPIALADYLIQNEGSLDELHDQLEKFLVSLTHE